MAIPSTAALGKRALALALLPVMLGIVAGLVLSSDPTVAEVDSDGDGFTDVAEAYMGTDPLAACNQTASQNDEQIDAWPPDFNDDTTVSIADAVLFRGLIGSMSGDGTYDVRFDLTADGKINVLDVVLLRPVFGTSCEPPLPPTPTPTPTGETTLPGRIEAEDYKEGGEGVGYHDTTAGNYGQAYRNDDVDIEVTTDIGDGYNVGWISTGEWLAFDVDIAQAGTYDITARMASGAGGTRTLHLTLDGSDVTGPMTLTDSTGWQDWRNVTVGGINLPAGSHELRIVADSDLFNLNYIDVVPEGELQVSTPTATSITSNSATITWTTNEPADSQVEYGTTTSYGSLATDTDLVTNHSVTLPELSPSTLYHYRVTSEDALGGSATSGDFTFTTSSVASTSASVDAGVDVNTFDPMMRGGAMVNWQHHWGKPFPNQIPGLVELAKHIRPGVIRYAGGLWANEVGFDRTSFRDPYTSWQWTDPDTGQPHPFTYSFTYWATEIDAVADFADQIGAEVMIQVNIADNNPEMWADLVRYANIEKGHGIKYWELGNELDFESRFGVNSINYADRFLAYRQAMKAVDPTIQLIGPAIAWAWDILFDGEQVGWFTQLLSETAASGEPVAALTGHWYHTCSSGSGAEERTSPEVILNYNTYLTGPQAGQPIADDWWLIRARRRFADLYPSALDSLKAATAPNALTGITELNTSACDFQSPQNGNHVAALWFTDVLGRFAYSGLDFVTMWNLYDTDENTIGYGMIYPDDALNPSRVFIRPTYYPYLMYSKWFGDQMVQSVSALPNDLSVWAARDTSDPDKLTLIVTNTSPENHEATLNIANFVPTSGVYYEMTNPNPLSTANASAQDGGGTTINGVNIDTTTPATISTSINSISGRSLTVGPSFSHMFPAYSATAIVLSSAGGS